jgi:hypothetical protein
VNFFFVTTVACLYLKLEFGFFVNQFGKRYREDYILFWTGYPTSFGIFIVLILAYIPPYILAFEPSYIEVRVLQTGEVCQIIPTNNLRPLNTQQEYLHFAYDQFDSQVIAKVVSTSEEESELFIIKS